MRPAAGIIIEAMSRQQQRQGGGQVAEIHISPALLRRYFTENPDHDRQVAGDPPMLFGARTIVMSRAEHERLTSPLATIDRDNTIFHTGGAALTERFRVRATTTTTAADPVVG